ncbi:ADP-ribosylglycohydrolase family protein [Microcoleus vaginatus]|uniref:ADP-ribosylglycohydrolase family protein n=1 Tax=Microcoleus vaginatus TaxID=119532 RepID=UPI001F61E4BD
MQLPSESAVELISRAGLPLNYQHSWQEISPFVVGSVLWSLYAFLRTPQDYWEILCTSIAVGGDVDTTAAMACAISGAFLGLEAMPNQLAELLNDQGSCGLGELIKLADNGYQLKVKL